MAIKQELAGMIEQCEALLKSTGIAPVLRLAYRAQIDLFKTKVGSMNMLELFQRANKLAAADMAKLRLMSVEARAAGAKPETQAAFVNHAVGMMKSFLA